jgi:hypothetical protein
MTVYKVVDDNRILYIKAADKRSAESKYARRYKRFRTVYPMPEYNNLGIPDHTFVDESALWLYSN